MNTNTNRKNQTPEEKYKGICNLIHGYSITFTVALAAIALILAGSVVGQIIDGRPAPDAITKSGFFAYYAALFALVANFIRQIFGRLKTYDTPFKPDIADKIKGLGYIMSGGGMGGALVFMLISLFMDEFGNEKFWFSYLTGFILAIAGLIFVVFAMIFEQGCKLQQESDETL